MYNQPSERFECHDLKEKSMRIAIADRYLHDMRRGAEKAKLILIELINSADHVHESAGLISTRQKREWARILVCNNGFGLTRIVLTVQHYF